MEYRRPHCQSPIYSRKNKICGVCEQPLPPELLFSAEQIKSLKEEMENEERRGKEFKRQISDLGPHDHGGSIGGIAGF